MFFYFCSLIRSQCIWFLILFSVVVIVITVGSKKYNTLSADMNIESVRAQHVFMPFLRVFSINYLLNIIVRFLFRYLNYIIHFYGSKFRILPKRLIHKHRMSEMTTSLYRSIIIFIIHLRWKCLLLMVFLFGLFCSFFCLSVLPFFHLFSRKTTPSIHQLPQSNAGV